jgi:uncharacterized membrane protein (DUF106 family)
MNNDLYHLEEEMEEEFQKYQQSLKEQSNSRLLQRMDQILNYFVNPRLSILKLSFGLSTSALTVL